jgi:hypothetical protein
VSEHDAFGNIINNGLTPRPAATTPVRGTWDLWDKAVGLLMVLLFVGPFAVGGWFAYTSLHTARSHRIDVPALMNTAPPARPATPAAPRHSGLGALRPAAVEQALAQHHGAVSLLRIDALGATFLSSPGTAPIAKSSIDPHAPQRLITAAARRLHASRNTINYVVLLKILNKPTWSAYFKDGAAFQADAHGHITRRIQ